MSTKISAYIIAFNEAEKITDAINSVLWADEIVVADSFSTDETAAMSEALGAKVVQIPFKGFGDLRNKAIAACSYDWIFSLDSDERCVPPVRDEVLSVINSDNALDAYYIPRRNFFMGKWIQHSGFYPDYRQPQLFRKKMLKFKNDPVHERFTISTHKIGYLKNPLWQIPFRNLAEVQHKSNKYSTLGAEKLAQQGKRGSMAKAFLHGLWAAFSIFFLKKGFLDGWPGFVIAVGNFEGTFYKYAKLYEKSAEWQLPDSPPLRR